MVFWFRFGMYVNEIFDDEARELTTCQSCRTCISYRILRYDVDFVMFVNYSFQAQTFIDMWRKACHQITWKSIDFPSKNVSKTWLQTDASRKRYSDPKISQFVFQMVPKWVQRLSWEAWSGLGWPVQAVLARSSLVMSCLPWSWYQKGLSGPLRRPLSGEANYEMLHAPIFSTRTNSWNHQN